MINILYIWFLALLLMSESHLYYCVWQEFMLFQLFSNLLPVLKSIVVHFIGTLGVWLLGKQENNNISSSLENEILVTILERP